VSRPAAAEVLAALSRVLRRNGRRWYVFGAQAVLAYGRPRLTSDVDVLIDPGRATGVGIARELADADFELRFALSRASLRTARLLPLVFAKTGTPVDAVLAATGLHDDFLARARRLDLGGVKVPVVSPEDLVVQKILAGRRKDLDDVRGVLDRQRAHLDAARIRDVLTALEHATGDARLLRRFDRLARA
jgi:predicted nucleotidyltransferase